jgi:hypothetical protein
VLPRSSIDSCTEAIQKAQFFFFADALDHDHGSSCRSWCYKQGVHTFSCGKLFKWLKFLVNALDHDHGRLARHLVILEQNLPWRAVTEDFGPNHIV